MATQDTGRAELGAEMDYAEHEKTYGLFLNLTKYIIVFVVSLMIAMAAGFFGGAGIIGSFVLFLLLCAVGTYFTR